MEPPPSARSGQWPSAFPPAPSRFHRIVVHPSTLCRIMQRLFVMGGTRAHLSAGLWDGRVNVLCSLRLEVIQLAKASARK